MRSSPPLTGLTAAGGATLPSIAAGSALTLTTTLARDGGYAVMCGTYCGGLHLMLPVRVSESYHGLSGTLVFPGSQTIL